MSALPLLATDSVRSSYFILAALLGLVGAAVGLYYLGVIGAVVTAISWVVRNAIRQGFLLWERTAGVGLLAGLSGDRPRFHRPGRVCRQRGSRASDIVFGLIPLVMGVTACLAYMFIDVERYEVERGYKAVHNPRQGAGAGRCTSSGTASRSAFTLLLAAAVGMIGGFALLNQGLYETVGRRAGIRCQTGRPTYADFLAYRLINLCSLVDVLDLAESHRTGCGPPYVRRAAWPASTLLTVYKSFFTLVLLQQVFASIRQGAGCWPRRSPTSGARTSRSTSGPGNALPQYGPRRGRAAARLAAGGRRADEGAAGPAARSCSRRSARFAIPTLIRLPGRPARARPGRSCGGSRPPQGPEALSWPRRADHRPERLRAGECRRGGRPDRRPDDAGPGPPAQMVQPGNGSRPPWHVRPAPPRIRPRRPGRRRGRSTPDPDSATRPAVRLQAAESLGRLGPAAFPACSQLVARLRDEDETVRCAAADRPGRVEMPGGRRSVDDAAPGPEPGGQGGRRPGLAALNVIAASAVPDLVPLLQDQDESVREAAADAIGQAGPLSAAVTDTLAGGLASEDTLVRAQTAEVIGTIGPAAEQSAPALVESLDDENDRVRAKAVKALGQIGEAAAEVAVPRLVRALRDPDDWVSALAAEALGEMGESAEAAVPALVRSLRHGTTQVRANAADALAKLGPGAAGAVSALIQTATDEDGGVRAAVRPGPRRDRLVHPGRPPHAPDGALADADPRVRAAAVEALGGAGTPGVVPTAELLVLLQDSNDQVKARAAQALPGSPARTRS